MFVDAAVVLLFVYESATGQFLLQCLKQLYEVDSAVIG